MILTGAKLEEIGKALYGDSWAMVLALRLRKSRKTVWRWRDSERAIPPDLRLQLVELIADQQAMLDKFGQELHEHEGMEP